MKAENNINITTNNLGPDLIQKDVNKLFNNSIQFGKYLGNENSTEVYQGIYNSKLNTKNEVIIKVIHRNDVENFNKILFEIGFIKYLSKFKSSKKYICLCYSVKLTSKYLVVIQEKPQGMPLSEFIKVIMNYDMNKYYKYIIIIMYHLLLAINYIHYKSVSHRNLNPETIYVNFENEKIKDIKITDFAVSCGKYYSLTTLANQDFKKANDFYFCETFNYLNNPPENFKIDELVSRIEKISTNQSRDLTYLYLAKKADIWSLGILFWKLCNYNKVISLDNPLLREFPKNYNSDESWKVFKGSSENNPIIKKLFEIVIKMMICEIPYRENSDIILENFIIINKYYDDEDEDLQ